MRPDRSTTVWTLVAGLFWFGFPQAGGAAGLAPNASQQTFDCVVDPSLTLKLGSPVASILQSVEVERGDVVKKGQVIARLESNVEASVVALNHARAQSNAEIEAKTAILEQKRGVLVRKMTLAQKSIGASQDVDTARAEYRVAEQELGLAQLNRRLSVLEQQRSQAILDQRTILSPVDGIVVQRQLGPGEYVRQDAYIVSVAAIDPLNVETFLPVSSYGQVAVGDTAIVRLDEPLGGERTAKITVVDRLSDAASGTFGVRLRLANPANLMPAGFRCHVTFAAPLKTVRR